MLPMAKGLRQGIIALSDAMDIAAVDRDVTFRIPRFESIQHTFFQLIPAGAVHDRLLIIDAKF